MMKPAAILALMLMLSASPALAACPVGQAPLLHVRIYFGLLIPTTGKRIPESTWEDFLTRTVTPRFPSGYTVYDAMGRWRDLTTKVVGREPSRIVEVDAPDSSDVRAKVEEIRKTYQTRFQQQAVGLVTEPVCGAF
jgi:hypothetical protein